jgi:hypothetical protein
MAKKKKKIEKYIKSKKSCNKGYKIMNQNRLVLIGLKEKTQS